jgi:sulfide:quinone oxidoreductase
MNVSLEIIVATAEPSPLAIFGLSASQAVGELLAKAGIEVFSSAYVEVPSSREIRINPGDRRIEVDRVVALPELMGPSVRGLPGGEHGFIPVTPYGEVRGFDRIYAAGDVVDFAIKHGGIAAQQADVVAASIARLAGAPVEPKPLRPTIQGMLLTGATPLYLRAEIAGGAGFASEVSEQPIWSPATKIAAKYLAPYLQAQDVSVGTVA